MFFILRIVYTAQQKMAINNKFQRQILRLLGKIIPRTVHKEFVLNCNAPALAQLSIDKIIL